MIAQIMQNCTKLTRTTQFLPPRDQLTSVTFYQVGGKIKEEHRPLFTPSANPDVPSGTAVPLSEARHYSQTLPAPAPYSIF